MLRMDVSRRRTRAAHAAELLVGCWSLERLEQRDLLTLAGNLLFPADNPWNQRVDQAPVAANSATLVASIGASSVLHPDFGTVYEGANIGIPYNVVSGDQPKVPVFIDAYPDESDLLPVPIPAGAVIEGDPLPSAQNDGDRHLIVYDEDNNVVYELFNAHRPSETSDGNWHADSEAVWDMTQDSFRTPGDTSADAAGLPILPGLVRADEVLDQGVIEHALRFTVPRSRNAYVFPASHDAGTNNASYPRMGERFRLKASFDILGFSPANQVILQALKDYGMIVADNGSSWFLSGAPSSRWNDDDLHQLTSILGSNFEAVDLTPVVTDVGPDAGATTGGTAVTIHGQNFSGAAGQLQVFFGTEPASSVSVISDTVLTAVAPPHAEGTVAVTVSTPYGESSTTNAPQFAYELTLSYIPSLIGGTGHQGRYIFYNQSKFDGSSAANNASDDNAIPNNKTVYLPGDGQMQLANITNFTKGLNGIMVDLTFGTEAHHTLIDASDFVFKVGTNNSPDTWATLTATPTISVRTGAGVSGSDRVDITWNNNVIQDEYLEVQVLATAHTGMNPNTFGTISGNAVGDVFFFGNLRGETASVTPGGNFARSLSADGNPIVAAGVVGGVGIDSFLDVDRSNSITLSGDRNPIVAGGVGSMTRISIGTAGPFAPEGGGGAAPATGGGDVGISSGLAAGSALMGGKRSTRLMIPDVVRSLESAARNDRRSDLYFQYLGELDIAGVGKTLDEFDAVADARSLDLDTLTSPFAKLRLE